MNTNISDVCLTKVVDEDLYFGADNCEPAVAKVDTRRDTVCPHCGESYYMVDGLSTTCMYFPPIYKNGVNVNPDRNIITMECTCMECGKRFEIKNR